MHHKCLSDLVFSTYVLRALFDPKLDRFQVWRPSQESEGYRPSCTLSAFLRAIPADSETPGDAPQQPKSPRRGTERKTGQVDRNLTHFLQISENLGAPMVGLTM